VDGNDSTKQPPRRSKARRLAFLLAACFLFLLFWLAVAEAVLRFREHRVLPPAAAPSTAAPSAAGPVLMFEADPELGWKNKPGNYEFPFPKPRGGDRKITILPDGTRATGPALGGEPSPARPKVFLFGCSYAQGWGIADNETLAWKLQSQYPAFEFRNYGVAAYGTYQSLLRLRRALKEPGRPALAIYAMVQHHEYRNVAQAAWLESLSPLGRGERGQLPYCTLDKSGALVEHPPATYPEWPLRRRLATVRALERIVTTSLSRQRERVRTEVTEKLILEMRDLCKAQGAAFVFLPLRINARDKHQRYLEFARKNGISTVDCCDLFHPTSDLIVPEDDHPNEKLNSLWAERVGKALAPMMNSE